MKQFLFILFTFFYQFVSSHDLTEVQVKPGFKRNALLISLGKPLFTDTEVAKRNFSLSLNYQYRFMKSFAIEPFYYYAQNNSYPDFFENEADLDKYIRSIEHEDQFFTYASWAGVNTHSMGLRFHFSFVHNPRWYLSFNFAMGYFYSFSSSHTLSYMTYNYSPFQVIDYKTKYFNKWNNGQFSMPGLLLKHTTKSNYFLGLHLTGYFFTDKIGYWSPEDMPVFPNHWNMSFTIGKVF